MVRAANTGVTCFVNEFGHVTQTLLDEDGNQFTEGTLLGQVAIPTNAEPTFYVRYGEWLAYACVAMTALVLAFLLLRRFIRR
jgi:apolipoprotein N-acyltransferase